MFSPKTNSLGCQPFKGASWALVLGLPLRDTIKSLLLVLGPFLIPTFGLVSWVCTPINGHRQGLYRLLDHADTHVATQEGFD